MIKHLMSIRTSGTIVPSSSFLVGRLLESVDFSSARTVVELGVGTGCVTREILKRMRNDARLISLEVNPEFVESCRDLRDPRFTLVEGCATELPRILRDAGVADADAVVSSLPLALMDDEVVRRILDVAQESLGADGTFVQYQYSLAHHAHLRRRYADVAVSFVPANVPPAFVYACRQRRCPSAPRTRSMPSFASAYAAALGAVAVAIRAFQQL